MWSATNNCLIMSDETCPYFTQPLRYSQVSCANQTDCENQITCICFLAKKYRLMFAPTYETVDDDLWFQMISVISILGYAGIALAIYCNKEL